MEERDQAKSDLEAERVDTELYLKDGLRDRTLASDESRVWTLSILAQFNRNQFGPQISEP